MTFIAHFLFQCYNADGLGERRKESMNKYEELSFTDDFMFCKVLTTNPELCHELLELIIGKRLEHLRGSISRNRLRLRRMEKESGLTCTARTTKNVVYDCEMQTKDNSNLPKRARYYQG